MNVLLSFLSVASVLGHKVVHITSNALSIYSNCAAVFLINLQRQTLDLPLYRKMSLPRRFSCKYIRIFSASSTGSKVSSLFSKIATLFNTNLGWGGGLGVGGRGRGAGLLLLTSYWFSLNNSEMIKAVTLVFCST